MESYTIWVKGNNVNYVFQNLHPLGQGFWDVHIKLNVAIKQNNRMHYCNSQRVNVNPPLHGWNIADKAWNTKQSINHIMSTIHKQTNRRTYSGQHLTWLFKLLEQWYKKDECNVIKAFSRWKVKKCYIKKYFHVYQIIPKGLDW